MKSGLEMTNNVFLNQNWEGEKDIQKGDFIIQLSNGLFPTDTPNFKASTPQTVYALPSHVVIATSNSNYVHSNPQPYTGGSVYEIGFFEDNSSDNVFEFLKEGEALVLRNKDSALQEQIARFALLYENNRQKNLYRETVPYVQATTRRKDRVERDSSGIPSVNGQNQLEQLELFRAFRAFMRFSQLEESIKQKKRVAPALSKNKGVSCSIFASYIYKSAIFAKNLAEGTLDREDKNQENLLEIYHQIEKAILRFPIKLMPAGNTTNEDGCYITFEKDNITCTILQNKEVAIIKIPLSDLNEANNKKTLFIGYERDRIKKPQQLISLLESKRSMLFDKIIEKNDSIADLSFLKNVGKLDAVLATQPQLFKRFTACIENSFTSGNVKTLKRPVKEATVKEFTYSIMADTMAWKGGICSNKGNTMSVIPYEAYQDKQANSLKFKK